MSDNLFVYGTLMPCQWNHHRIEQYVYRARPATIRGTLISLGSIPALVPGQGLVRGVLLEVHEAALVIADRLEGYRADDPERSFYVRKRVVVCLDDGEDTEAWVYEYASSGPISGRQGLNVGIQNGLPVYSWTPSP